MWNLNLVGSVATPLSHLKYSTYTRFRKGGCYLSSECFRPLYQDLGVSGEWAKLSILHSIQNNQHAKGKGSTGIWKHTSFGNYRYLTLSFRRISLSGICVPLSRKLAAMSQGPSWVWNFWSGTNSPNHPNRLESRTHFFFSFPAKLTEFFLLWCICSHWSHWKGASHSHFPWKEWTPSLFRSQQETPFFRTQRLLQCMVSSFSFISHRILHSQHLESQVSWQQQEVFIPECFEWDYKLNSSVTSPA